MDFGGLQRFTLSMLPGRASDGLVSFQEEVLGLVKRRMAQVQDETMRQWGGHDLVGCLEEGKGLSWQKHL